MRVIAFLFAASSLVFKVVAQSALSAGGFTPAGPFQVQVQGSPLLIEYTTNLATWTPLTNSQGTIVDASSANSEWRFYRGRAARGFVSNVVGYARVPVQPGKLAALASPFSAPLRLDQPAGRTAVFGSATPPVQIYLTKNGKQETHTFDELDNGWQPPLAEIPWGTGFVVRNNGKAPINVTFTGELPQGALKRPIPTGETMIGPLVPKPGPVQEALAAIPAAGARIQVWNEQSQQYQATVYDPQANRWDPALTYKPGRGIVVNWPEPSFQTQFSATK